MKSLTWLWRCILTDVGIRCDTDTHRDIKTMSRRIKHEGLSFLTITLPVFCSDFERSLSIGHVDSEAFRGYRKTQALPSFLRGLLSQVFDPVSGRLLEDPSIDAIFSIRQVCLMFKKVNLPCTEQRTRRALDAYLQVEKELTGPAGVISGDLLRGFRKISGIVWSDTTSRVAQLVNNGEIVPRHGPGATAERILGNQKFVIRRWHTRLETYFPFDAFGIHTSDGLELVDSVPQVQVEFVEPEAEQPVRVVLVPKTLKSPRIIAIEPVCMQYTQQALMDPIVDSIETCGPSAGHVNFRDQSINGDLALQGSIDGSLATIDLSDASDRVSCDLVVNMLWHAPDLLDAVFACRSTRANLPTGETVQLGKFASMGSALCFPIESMVFFTIAIYAALKELNLPITPKTVRQVSRGIYVYGDDIIVPTTQVSATMEYLELFKLKVNRRKSFWTGKFRESCGVDAYDGVNITPVYVRSMPPRSRQDGPEVLSFVSLANQLYMKGWWRTAMRVREYVESLCGPIPHVLESSPCLGWVSVQGHYSVQRWNEELHRFEVKAMQASVRRYRDPLEGYGALMKYFLKRSKQPILGEHLERSVRPGSASIKYRWASPC